MVELFALRERGPSGGSGVNWGWFWAAVVLGLLCVLAVVLPFWIGSWH
jgi:hypothetical protein